MPVAYILLGSPRADLARFAAQVAEGDGTAVADARWFGPPTSAALGDLRYQEVPELASGELGEALRRIRVGEPIERVVLCMDALCHIDQPLRPLADSAVAIYLLKALRARVPGRLRVVSNWIPVHSYSPLGYVTKRVSLRWLRYWDSRLLSLAHGVGVRVRGVQRLLKRADPPASRDGQRLRVGHTVCSMGLGGTQRQVRFLQEGAPPKRHRHTVYSLQSEFDYWPGAVCVRGAVPPWGPFWSRWTALTLGIPEFEALGVVQALMMAAVFRARRPDVVVGWGNEHAPHAHLAAALAGVPFVYSIRTLRAGLAEGEQANRIRRMHRASRRWRLGTIVNSPASRLDYVEWIGGEPAGGVELVLNGLDARQAVRVVQRGRAACRRQLGLPAEPAVLIGALGRLSGEKDQATLVRAVALLPEAHLVLVGDGPEEERLRALGAELGLGERLRLVGAQRDVWPWLGALDVFVLPSLVEGMSNALIEAMLARLPVVATAVGGTVDQIEDRRHGLLVDAQDPEAMAAAIASLLADPEWARELALAAQQRARAQHSAAAMVSHLEDALERFLGWEEASALGRRRRRA